MKTCLAAAIMELRRYDELLTMVIGFAGRRNKTNLRAWLLLRMIAMERLAPFKSSGQTLGQSSLRGIRPNTHHYRPSVNIKDDKTDSGARQPESKVNGSAHEVTNTVVVKAPETERKAEPDDALDLEPVSKPIMEPVIDPVTRPAIDPVVEPAA